MPQNLYSKTKTGDLNPNELQAEVNANIIIIPSCLSISQDGDNLSLDFAAALSTAEETELDVVILAHVPPVDTIKVSKLPLSELGNKLAIHSSTKPAQAGKEFYLVWTGAGDDVVSTPNVIGEGDLLQFTLAPGIPKQVIESHFSPDFGDVFIHEGYAKWDTGGAGDYLEADIIASASPLQQAANLDLEIANNWVTFATGGPGTGTHGFASSPILIKRSKSLDGDWDYDGVNLTPNMSGTGLYKISEIERAVHHYFNKIPVRGSSYGYTNLTSDESAWLPPGYFIRITANNVSDTDWVACVFMEVFREQTAVP